MLYFFITSTFFKFTICFLYNCIATNTHLTSVVNFQLS